MKNPNHPIGNRTRDFPVCNQVPQLTALPPHFHENYRRLCAIYV